MDKMVIGDTAKDAAGCSFGGGVFLLLVLGAAAVGLTIAQGERFKAQERRIDKMLEGNRERLKEAEELIKQLRRLERLLDEKEKR